MKKISVVVPIYYGEIYIPNIISQIEECKKYLDDKDYIEIIFVNDAPDAPISNQWESESIFLIIMNTNKNIGIHGARVKGLKECQGDYVLFLDQDDLIKPQYFYNQLSAIKENDAVICKAIHAGKDFYPNDEVFQSIISKRYMLGKWNHILSPGQALLRKKAIPKIWCDAILKYNGADDWFLWISMLSMGRSFSLNAELLYEHVVHDKNASNNILEMVQSQQEVISIIQRKGILNGNDLNLLLNAFFARYTNWIWELDIIKRKFSILDKWMKLEENGVKLAEYLSKAGIKTCGIYGCGILGEHLYDNLKKSINIKYFVDRNAGQIDKNIPIYTIEDAWPETDIIIITLLNDSNVVEKKIKAKSNKKTLILTDWIMKGSAENKLFLFGAGQISQTYTEFLGRLSVEIYGYVDNDANRWGTYFFDRKIYSPDILEKEEALVLIACADIESITAQLAQMRVQNKIVTIEHIIRKTIEQIKVSEKHHEWDEKFDYKSRNIIVDNLDGSWGGAEDWAHKLALFLSQRGYSINLIENIGSPTESSLEQITSKLNKKNESIYFELVDMLLKQKPFTLINIWSSEVLWAASYIKRLYPGEVQIISSVLNDQEIFYHHQCEWDGFIDSYLCISGRIKNNLTNLYGINESKVYYKEPFVEYREYSRHKYNMQYGKKLQIGYPCRLTCEQKRADLLPKLIELLEKRNIDYVLNIAGEGPCESQIKEYIENKKLNNKVKLYGRLTRVELLNFLNRQDIYLNYSEFEGTSLTMLEAMASGCVPVVTKVSGVEDFIENMVNGMISEVGNLESIADNIEFLDKNREKIGEYGSKSKSVISFKCNLNDYIDYVEDLIVNFSAY